MGSPGQYGHWIFSVEWAHPIHMATEYSIPIRLNCPELHWIVSAELAHLISLTCLDLHWILRQNGPIQSVKPLNIQFESAYPVQTCIGCWVRIGPPDLYGHWIFNYNQANLSGPALNIESEWAHLISMTTEYSILISLTCLDPHWILSRNGPTWLVWRLNIQCRMGPPNPYGHWIFNSD